MAIDLEELNSDIKMIQEMAISDIEIQTPRYQEYSKNNKAYVDNEGVLQPDKVVEYVLHECKDDVTALEYIASELDDPKNQSLNAIAVSNRANDVKKVNDGIGQDYYKSQIQVFGGKTEI